MKKKARGANFDVVLKFLDKNGATSAINIQKATKIKGNIYTLLQRLLTKKQITKVGKLYSIDRRMPLFLGKSRSLSGEKISDLIHQKSQPQPQPQPNPYANILKREAEHLASGIEQLTIARNYILLRIKELERVTQ